MTRINRNNIEELWQRFLDCQLSETEEAELMAYLESNPDVMAMLEASDAEDDQNKNQSECKQVVRSIQAYNPKA